MESGTYAVEAAVEETHWWFVCRRELFAREIARLNLKKSSRIIDVGTGTGAGLRLLRNLGFADVQGVDMSDEAIKYCAQKNLGQVRKGSICDLPFSDDACDLVCATDVIEHVDDDAQALRELSRVLSKDAHALITVPTFPSLWGLQDEVAHHKRRYRLSPLLAAVKAAGLEPVRYYYFNYILFAPVWLARQIIRTANIQLRSENEVNSPSINQLLTLVFRLDCLTAAYLRPPFGVSAFVLARKL
jgi:ubiquinone/menaquinone biosynthesis C-methylase UbiE